MTKVATAVLSTTAKAKAREKKKAAEEEAMETVCVGFSTILLRSSDNCMKDEKVEKKKDADVEMKTDDASPSGKHGDVSPLSGSISNLAEGSTAEPKPKRKAEPAFETLSNFSRVTPAQLPYLVFPPDGRYQPVRAVSTTTVPAKASTKGGIA